MNIYKHEFKMKLGSVINWSVSLVLLIFLFMSIYSGFADSAALLNETMAQMPQELLVAFGLTDIDMSTVLGFYSVAFLFCQICLSIQAANYGFGLVSVEETDMTADFLLAKPVGRSSIMTTKLLAALTSLTITNAVVWISSFVAINLFRDSRAYEIQTLLLLLLGILPFQLFFLSVGMVISLLMNRVRSVTSASMALAFGMYVLSVFGGMLGEDTFDLITPFKHFEANSIIANAAYDMPLVMISVTIIVVSIAGSYLLYGRRNIQTAM